MHLQLLTQFAKLFATTIPTPHLALPSGTPGYTYVLSSIDLLHGGSPRFRSTEPKDVALHLQNHSQRMTFKNLYGDGKIVKEELEKYNEFISVELQWILAKRFNAHICSPYESPYTKHWSGQYGICQDVPWLKRSNTWCGVMNNSAV